MKTEGTKFNVSLITSLVLVSLLFLIQCKSVKNTKVKETARPEPAGWYAGDMHVHRDCGGPVDKIPSEETLIGMMDTNDLAVITVLADMGNGEVKPADEDLPKVNGKDHPVSKPGRILHYDAEWHWDPYGITFEKKALGGHVVLLGLTEVRQIWEESPYKILEYGKKQNAIVGFCHGQYLNDSIQQNLNCCIPIEYPVEAVLGNTDFITEDVFGTNSPNYGSYSADATIHAYYKLLNCGIRLGLCAGTDYPCNVGEPLGTLLTYVRVEGPLTYRKWIEGIRDGKTVVSRNAHKEFIDLKINNTYQPGDEIKDDGETELDISVTWTSMEKDTGRLEIVHNGTIVTSEKVNVSPGDPYKLQFKHRVPESGWICARRMDDNGHQTHTAPVYVTVDNESVRASAEDAEYFVAWIDNLIEKTSPGNDWNQYFTHDLDVVQGRYKKARNMYLQIAEEAEKANK